MNKNDNKKSFLLKHQKHFMNLSAPALIE